MAQTELTCDTLGELDGGRARGMINAALNSTLSDLDDRGEDEKPRCVTIKLTFRKTKGNVATEVEAASKVPAYRSNETITRVTQKTSRTGRVRATAEFQQHNPENVDQPTLKAMDE